METQLHGRSIGCLSVRPVSSVLQTVISRSNADKDGVNKWLSSV